MDKKSIKPLFRSHRQSRKVNLRRMYCNPWDDSSSSSSSRKLVSSSRKTKNQKAPKKSAMKKSSGNKKTKKKVSFREPLDRSRSTTSSAHSAWHSVSSK